jgi:hypothetical protein
MRTKRSRSLAHVPPDLQSWDDVNDRLGLLGEVDRQLRVLRDDFEQKVAVLKQQWLESSRPIEKERGRVQAQIERFYWTRREELLARGHKSVELAFGRLGSRLPAAWWWTTPPLPNNGWRRTALSASCAPAPKSTARRFVRLSSPRAASEPPSPTL